MSILDKLIHREMYQQRRDEFAPKVYAAIESEPTGKIEPRGFATQKEYSMSLICTVTYWANDAQRNDARRHAEIVLAHELYSEALRPLARIRSAIMDGARSEAMYWCGMLEQELKGER